MDTSQGNRDAAGGTSSKSGRDLLSRRLSARCSGDTWIGACVRVVDAARREGTDAVEHTPDHYLAAAWAPGAPRSRWPDAVVIGSPDADNALALLLNHVPDGAKLFLADLDSVDAALAARILLAADSNLEPYQRDGIASFVAAEDARVASRIAAGYTDRDQGFERFRARVLDVPGERG